MGPTLKGSQEETTEQGSQRQSRKRVPSGIHLSCHLSPSRQCPAPCLSVLGLCTPSKWTLGDVARSVGYGQIDITLIPSKSGVPVPWLPYHRDHLSKSPLPLDLVLPRTSLWPNLGTHSYSTQSSFLPHYLHLVFLAMPWSRASCESCSFLFFLTFF